MRVAVVVILIAACLEAVARWHGDHQAIWMGGLSGLGVGAVGGYFAFKIARRHRNSPRKPEGFGDIWGFWSIGFLVRLLMVLAVGSWMYVQLGPRCSAGLLAMASVYLVLLVFETLWLYQILVEVPANEIATER